MNPNGATTAWVPGSKPVWFTEYGFASVDGCSNEPNVFVDAATSDSAFPRQSRGRVDFMAQRVAIAGFDNMTPEVNGIGLTTIAQDAERKGEIAVELLLKNGPVTHYALEYQLIVRETA